MYPSLESRKNAEAERRGKIAGILAARLSPFAREHGCQFIVYGSLAGERRGMIATSISCAISQILMRP